jgi:hypothetical protein
MYHLLIRLMILNVQEADCTECAYVYDQSPFKISQVLLLSIRYFSLSIMKLYRLFIAAIASHSLQDSHVKSIFVCLESAL